MATDREKTTEMFLAAQGYDRDRIAKAISLLSGNHQETANADSPLLTPRDLCAVLRISSTTLWRLNPPCVVVGARKRYQIAEVKAFLAKHRGGNGISISDVPSKLSSSRHR